MTSKLGMIYLLYQVCLAGKVEYPMNKEEILAKSRNENKGMDIMELQSLEKASKVAAKVGMLLCCFVAVMEVAVTGQLSLGSWLIYFGILCTLFFMKYRLMKNRHELLLSIFYTMLFLLFLILFLLKLLC